MTTLDELSLEEIQALEFALKLVRAETSKLRRNMNFMNATVGPMVAQREKAATAYKLLQRLVKTAKFEYRKWLNSDEK